MKKLLTSRQLSMILFISVISLKFLVFPAITTKFAGRSAYVSFFLYLLIELSIIVLVLLFVKKYNNYTFSEVLTLTFGKVFAKIVFFVLFIYFIFKTLFLIKETHNYFLEVIFDDLPWIYFTLPLTAYILFVMTKSINIMARTIEILFWFLIVSIGLTVLAPSYRIDLFNILPMFENGLIPVFNGMLYSSFSFGDFLVLLLLMGRIDFSNGGYKKICFYGIFCLIFVTAFYVVFTAIFDNTGINHILAISDISVRSSYPYTQEKLDWLAILIWSIVLLFQIGVYAIITKNCFNEVFKFKSEYVAIVTIATILFALSFALYFNLELLIKIATSPPFVIVIISIYVAIIVILIIMSVVLKFKKVNCKSNDKHLCKQGEV